MVCSSFSDLASECEPTRCNTSNDIIFLRCDLGANPRRVPHLLFQWRRQGARKNNETFGSKRDRGVSSEAPMPSRGSCHNAHSRGRNFSGRLAALEISGAAPTPTSCSSGPAKLGRMLLRARRAVASVSLSSQFTQSHQQAMRFPANPLTLPKYFAKLASVLDRPRSARSLEELFGADAGVATTGMQRGSQWRSRRRRAPAAGRPCPGAVHSTHPSRVQCLGVITAAHDTSVRENLMTLPRECWSWQRHAKEHLLHRCGHFRTLRRVVGSWPLLGLSEPGARPDVHWPPAEASAVIVWHREAAALEAKHALQFKQQ